MAKPLKIYAAIFNLINEKAYNLCFNFEIRNGKVSTMLMYRIKFVQVFQLNAFNL